MIKPYWPERLLASWKRRFQQPWKHFFHVPLLAGLLLAACASNNPFTEREPNRIDAVELSRVPAGQHSGLTTASSLGEQEDLPAPFGNERDVRAVVLVSWCEQLGEVRLRDVSRSEEVLYLTIDSAVGAGQCVLWSILRDQLSGVSSVIVLDSAGNQVEIAPIFP